jgi:hypothetical protein
MEIVHSPITHLPQKKQHDYRNQDVRQHQFTELILIRRTETCGRWWSRWVRVCRGCRISNILRGRWWFWRWWIHCFWNLGVFWFRGRRNWIFWLGVNRRWSWINRRCRRIDRRRSWWVYWRRRRSRIDWRWSRIDWRWSRINWRWSRIDWSRINWIRIDWRWINWRRWSRIHWSRINRRRSRINWRWGRIDWRWSRINWRCWWSRVHWRINNRRDWWINNGRWHWINNWRFWNRGLRCKLISSKACAVF